ncbi:2-oxo acid dehydrogenase subunit E2 [Candidatus Symbiobacter mobilis]|uniref:Dihydrolipoamide acetyltransferase component of pyruvate dehydrogenase complex n=1 Tax=Candidatus Symbiobacter mobilis CR TaxID=946483 RepID=U5N9H8_9BURK|nr:2-oxo acid dehydrogenase subunit E2 [Candidatus Symbiobacter mobilis]AGX88226.1 pyruvate dehydrogenase E2 component [Candidatus Symbiobacter mobilis CR]
MPSLTVQVPDIGDFADVGIIELLVAPGDRISVGQSLVTVESDKASMEIPSTHAGIVQSLLVAVGDQVREGSALLVLDTDVAQASAPSTAPATPSPASALPSAPPAAPPAAIAQGPIHASPLARQEARTQGVPLDTVPPTGPNGRITADDVRSMASAPVAAVPATVPDPVTGTAAASPSLDLPPWPQVDHAKFGPIERKPLGRIQKISAAHLTRNAMGIPTVTNHDDADITELEAFRVTINAELASAGTKLTMLAFLIRACAATLQKFPSFNSSLDGDALVLKKYYHIGFAADTPQGLVVPVLRDADQKGIVQIAQETAALAAKAREGKLSPAEMSGATFTISSLGGIGGRYFTPIINAPEVAILGVCRAQQAPAWNGTAFVPRLMLPLSLSWDHRVVDGAGAARFLAHLQGILEDFRRVLL